MCVYTYIHIKGAKDSTVHGNDGGQQHCSTRGSEYLNDIACCVF